MGNILFLSKREGHWVGRISFIKAHVTVPYPTVGDKELGGVDR